MLEIDSVLLALALDLALLDLPLSIFFIIPSPLRLLETDLVLLAVALDLALLDDTRSKSVSDASMPLPRLFFLLFPTRPPFEDGESSGSVSIDLGLSARTRPGERVRGARPPRRPLPLFGDLELRKEEADDMTRLSMPK